jgi:hypothetical protein
MRESCMPAIRPLTQLLEKIEATCPPGAQPSGKCVSRREGNVFGSTVLPIAKLKKKF